MKIKLKKVDDVLSEELKDPYFRELYELEQQKVNIIKPILAYRIKNDLTQSELANQLGITQQHISKIEGGDFANIETLEKVLLLVGYTVRMHAVPLKPRTIQTLRRSIQKKLSQS